MFIIFVLFNLLLIFFCKAASNDRSYAAFLAARPCACHYFYRVGQIKRGQLIFLLVTLRTHLYNLMILARRPVGGQGAKPTEADGILVLEYTFFALSWSNCSGSDLTEATRQRRTFDTAAILSVGLNDSLNGADVSHLEVICDFLQVQSLDRCVAFWFSVA